MGNMDSGFLFNSAFGFLKRKNRSDAKHSELEREAVVKVGKGMPTRLYPLPSPTLGAQFQGMGEQIAETCTDDHVCLFVF